MRIPHTQPADWPPEISPTRFAAHIERESVQGCQVALLGLPDDTGVRLNYGRPGARQGPGAVRQALARYGIAEPFGWDWPRVFDAGDVIPATIEEGASFDRAAAEEAVHETHRRTTEAAAALLDLGLLPIAIGGGHDLTFPFVRAAAAKWPRLAGVYFDAHLDVREAVGSGMPFRRLIEDCGVRDLHVHGLNSLANTREHLAWFIAHGGQVVGGDRPMPPAEVTFPAGDIFVSFDLDVLDGAHAPGVSAVNPCGWLPAAAEAWALAAGRHPGVRCFDVMELSPPHDVEGRTARIAAHLLLMFLRGLGERARERETGGELR